MEQINKKQPQSKSGDSNFAVASPDFDLERRENAKRTFNPKNCSNCDEV